MMMQDLKTIIDLMPLAGRDFDCVCIHNGFAYVADGPYVVRRPLIDDDNYFIYSDDLDMLKAVYKKEKKNERVNAIMFKKPDHPKFPNIGLITDMFNKKPEMSSIVNGKKLSNIIKSMGKADSDILIGTSEKEESPITITHQSGQAILAPIVR
jgi:hypothetical protein